MNKKNICIAIVLMLSGSCFSQQLISTAGQQENNVSWSIGEMITEASIVSGMLVAQGFNGSEITPLGMSDVAFSRLSVYPNPVVDKLYIKGAEGLFSYSIVDLVGRVLLTKKADSDLEIDMSQYDSGQYILKICTSQFTKSSIILKK